MTRFIASIFGDGWPFPRSFQSACPAEQFSSPKAYVYCGDFGLEDALEPGTEVIVHWPHLRAEGR